MNVVQGGWQCGATRLFGVRGRWMPGGAVAHLLEEDTALVMSPSLDASGAADDPAVRVYTALHDFQALTPGAVVVRREAPLVLALVVLNLEATPISRPEWVGLALVRAFAQLALAGCPAARLPALGVRSGALAAEDFVSVLAGAVNAMPDSARPRMLGLEAPTPDLARALDARFT